MKDILKELAGLKENLDTHVTQVIRERMATQELIEATLKMRDRMRHREDCISITESVNEGCDCGMENIINMFDDRLAAHNKVMEDVYD